VGERVQHTYTCQCKGHESGSLEFEAAPPEWFREKGINTPVWCPDCRKWRDAQVDEAVRCIECGEGIRLSRRLKISIHKKEGPFRRPEKCKLCESGKRKKMAPSTVRRKPPKVVIGDLVDKLILVTDPPTPITIVTDINEYQFTVGDPDFGPHRRQEHLERHIPGHTVRTQYLADLERIQSTKNSTPTCLVGPGADFNEFTQAIAVVARETDGNIVRQVTQGTKILKIRLNGKFVEKTIIDTRSNKIVTSFDTFPLTKIVSDLGGNP
jgi:hypothetical protein